MVNWRKLFFVFLILTILTGSGLAKANLLTDSPWACFFNNRIEKVDPATGQLSVVEDGEKSDLTYSTIGGQQVIAQIKYPSGAYSTYDYYSDGKVKSQSLIDENGNLVFKNLYTYTGSQTVIETSDGDGTKRLVKISYNEGIANAKEVYDLEYSDFEPIEEWQYRDNELNVSRLQYLGLTDAYFEATDWDQLLLSYYEPTEPAVVQGSDFSDEAAVKEFDGLGRLRKLIIDDTEATFNYNWLGLPSLLVIKADGKTQTYEYNYDALGRRVLDPSARRVKVTYSYVDGKLQQITTPNGIITYHYEDGKLASRTDALGQRTDFTFDEEELILSATYYNGTSVSVRYAADGKRLSMQDPAGETFYEYNELGQLTKLTRKDSSGEEFVIVHEYSPAGLLAQVITPNGKSIPISVQENILMQVDKLLTEPVLSWLN